MANQANSAEAGAFNDVLANFRARIQAVNNAPSDISDDDFAKAEREYLAAFEALSNYPVETLAEFQDKFAALTDDCAEVSPSAATMARLNADLNRLTAQDIDEEPQALDSAFHHALNRFDRAIAVFVEARRVFYSAGEDQEDATYIALSQAEDALFATPAPTWPDFVCKIELLFDEQGNYRDLPVSQHIFRDIASLTDGRPSRVRPDIQAQPALSEIVAFAQQRAAKIGLIRLD